MTRNLSDLLAVYLLAREAGLATLTPEGLVCHLPVVPLFETISDLDRSPEILEKFSIIRCHAAVSSSTGFETALQSRCSR
jgi:phosphoenolpyruvate carboxylase